MVRSSINHFGAATLPLAVSAYQLEVRPPDLLHRGGDHQDQRNRDQDPSNAWHGEERGALGRRFRCQLDCNLGLRAISDRVIQVEKVRTNVQRGLDHRCSNQGQPNRVTLNACAQALAIEQTLRARRRNVAWGLFAYEEANGVGAVFVKQDILVKQPSYRPSALYVEIPRGVSRTVYKRPRSAGRRPTAFMPQRSKRNMPSPRKRHGQR